LRQIHILLAFLTGFAVGSIPLGVIVARASAGIDIRRYGTGNIGAYNVWRNVGILAAAHAKPGRPRVPDHGPDRGRAIGVGTGAATALYPPGLLVLLVFYGLGALMKQLAPGVLLGLIAYVAVVFMTNPSLPIRVSAAALLVVVVARRLEGAVADLGREDVRAVLWARLLHDRRPGQQLSGPIGG
jgi:glycerol-3-phosphate acyltransferase PlsY